MNLVEQPRDLLYLVYGTHETFVLARVGEDLVAYLAGLVCVPEKLPLGKKVDIEVVLSQQRKDTQDIMYIFFALATGMAAGAGYRKIAIVRTLFIGVVLLAFSLTAVAVPRREDFLLQFFLAQRH